MAPKEGVPPRWAATFAGAGRGGAEGGWGGRGLQGGRQVYRACLIGNYRSGDMIQSASGISYGPCDKMRRVTVICLDGEGSLRSSKCCGTWNAGWSCPCPHYTSLHEMPVSSLYTTVSCSALANVHAPDFKGFTDGQHIFSLLPSRHKVDVSAPVPHELPVAVVELLLIFSRKST